MRFLGLLVAIVVILIAGPAWLAIVGGVVAAFFITMGPLAAIGAAIGLLLISWWCRYQEPEE